MSDDIKERLLDFELGCAGPMRQEAAARIEALEVERSCTCCDIPCPLEALARIEALEAQLAAAREALEHALEKVEHIVASEDCGDNGLIAEIVAALGKDTQ